MAGLWQGFLDLKDIGAIDHLPRLIAAEAHRSLAIALCEGGGCIPDEAAAFQTLALSIGATQSAFQALQALRQSDGRAVALGNDGLIATQEELAATEGLLESVRSLYQAALSLAMRRIMRRIMASWTKARCERVRFSKALASRRQRPSHPNVRDVLAKAGIQRLGSTTNPFVSQRLTISSGRRAAFLTAAAVVAP